MKLPVDMSSSDRYKISLHAQPVSLFETKKGVCIDNAAFISFVRPLGKVRSKNARLADDNTGSCYTNLVNCSESEMDKKGLNKMEGDSRWGSSYERGRSSSESCKSSPRRQLSKSQAFENLYKIAAARQPQKREVKPTNMYNKRVIHLPMFKLNLQTYVGQQKDIEFVENARQSLKEMIKIGRNAPRVLGSERGDITNQQTLSYDNGLRTNRSTKPHLFRDFSDVTSERVKPGKVDPVEPRRSVSALQGRISVVDTLDTDRMDVKYDSLDINTSTSLESLNVDYDGFTCTTPGQRPVSKTEDANSVACSSVTQGSVWPSFDDIRRMRRESGSKKSNGSLSKSYELRGRHFVSANPQQAVQNWIEDHETTPVLRYTSKQSKFKLDPIVVPSHTCEDCNVCHRNANGYGDNMSCPPNSPTFDDEVLNEVAQANEAVVSDDDINDDSSNILGHGVRFVEEPLYISHPNHFEHSYKTTNDKVAYNKKVRNGAKIPQQPIVLPIPKVTVKILATKEEFQEATSKMMNYTKTSS